MRRSLVVTAIMIGVVFPALARQSPIREGKWEITMEMDMPGMPMKMPPMTITQCITKEEAEDPSKLVPKNPQDKGSDCKMSDYKMTGSTISWTMKCETPEPMTGKGEITFSGDTYEGSMTMSTQRGDMAMKYKGKRLGDCSQ
jgi:hypothetical protein